VQRQWFGLLLVSTAAASSAATATYDIAGIASANLLFGREDCPTNKFRCSTELGAAFSNICCENGQACTFDQNQQPACCPSGVVCTGAAPSSEPTNAPVSYVSNSYFSFPYAPTTYTDIDQCTSAADACSRNYEACTSGLQGGGNGFAVTIDVPGGGGVTVGGPAQNLGASATAVCASLSSEACGELQPTDCDTFVSASTRLTSPTPSALLLTMGIGAGVATLLLG
jgi:hypothetical protein